MLMNYGAGPEGVPTPLTFIVHPYPTRYHGPIYTRPEWGPREFMQNTFNFAAGPDGSMSGFGESPTIGDSAAALFSQLTAAQQAAAEEVCAPLCEKVKYQWGAYGLLVGGGLAWVVGWTLGRTK